MSKRWYVVQVYTGYEENVKANLKKQAEEEDLADLFDEILIPAGEVASFLAGAPSKKEKIFPGYLLVHMDMTPEAFRLVASMPRVMRFLGGESPAPLSTKEVERIFAQMQEEHTIPSSERESFIVGSEVQIIGGPFSGFNGSIDKVDDERERLIVMVSIFGRLTPVELDFDQVKI